MTDAEALRTCAIFAGIEDGDLNIIAQKMSMAKINKGAYLFFRDDPSKQIYFVIDGAFQIIIDNEANKEIIVYTIASGDIIGELSLFNNHTRSATAVALDDSCLLKISNEQFINLMGVYPAIGVNLCRVLVERLLAADETIERLGAMDGTQRVVHFLRALLVREGTADETGFVIEKRPTYYQISQRLGISEKTIYRTIRSLASSGHIDIKGKRLSMKREFMEHGEQ